MKKPLLILVLLVILVSGCKAPELTDIDLSKVRKFVRVQIAGAFTGGTTPANDYAAVVVLGGNIEPT